MRDPKRVSATDYQRTGNKAYHRISRLALQVSPSKSAALSHSPSSLSISFSLAPSLCLGVRMSACARYSLWAVSGGWASVMRTLRMHRWIMIRRRIDDHECVVDTRGLMGKCDPLVLRLGEIWPLDGDIGGMDDLMLTIKTTDRRLNWRRVVAHMVVCRALFAVCLVALLFCEISYSLHLFIFSHN